MWFSFLHGGDHIRQMYGWGMHWAVVWIIIQLVEVLLICNSKRTHKQCVVGENREIEGRLKKIEHSLQTVVITKVWVASWSFCEMSGGTYLPDYSRVTKPISSTFSMVFMNVRHCRVQDASIRSRDANGRRYGDRRPIRVTWRLVILINASHRYLPYYPHHIHFHCLFYSIHRWPGRHCSLSASGNWTLTWWILPSTELCVKRTDEGGIVESRRSLARLVSVEHTLKLQICQQSQFDQKY